MYDLLENIEEEQEKNGTGQDSKLENFLALGYQILPSMTAHDCWLAGLQQISAPRTKHACMHTGTEYKYFLCIRVERMCESPNIIIMEKIIEKKREKKRRKQGQKEKT